MLPLCQDGGKPSVPYDSPANFPLNLTSVIEQKINGFDILKQQSLCVVVHLIPDEQK